MLAVLEVLEVLRQQRLGQALALDLLQQVLEAEVLQVLEVEVLEVLEVDLSLCLLAQPLLQEQVLEALEEQQLDDPELRSRGL